MSLVHAEGVNPDSKWKQRYVRNFMLFPVMRKVYVRLVPQIVQVICREIIFFSLSSYHICGQLVFLFTYLHV